MDNINFQEKRESAEPFVRMQETILMSGWSPVFETVVQAIRIGDLGIAALPCEVFAETGLEIKAWRL